MATLTTLSGKVSQVAPIHHMSGSRRSGPGPDEAVTALSFRVGSQPAWFSGRPNLGEGDVVTVAGVTRAGVLAALAIRNRSTGVDYGGASAARYCILGLALLLGIFTVRLGGVGIPLLALAGWLWTGVRRRAKALALVRSFSSPGRPTGS